MSVQSIAIALVGVCPAGNRDRDRDRSDWLRCEGGDADVVNVIDVVRRIVIPVGLCLAMRRSVAGCDHAAAPAPVLAPAIRCHLTRAPDRTVLVVMRGAFSCWRG